MSQVNEKYIGESMMREEPKKKIGLVVRDKAITPEKLSDEVIGRFEHAEEDIEDLQNQIDSLEISGLALSQRLGDNPHIGISQKKITEVFEEHDRVDEDFETRLHAMEEITEISVEGGTIGIVNTPEEIQEGVGSLATGNALAKAYGHYESNPEWLHVLLDENKKVLAGIKTDGSVFFGEGCPSQVKDYIEEQMEYITGIEDYEERVEELRELIGYLEHIIEIGGLEELLDKKVDKVDGQSLINADYANGIRYIDNPEFAEVRVDVEDRILEATMKDGIKYLPVGCSIDGNTCKTISNPEFIGIWVDGSDHLLLGLRKDGDVVFGTGVPSEIVKYAENLIVPIWEKIEEHEETYGRYEENPEFVRVDLDADGRIIEAVKSDGVKFFGAGCEIDGNVVTTISNPEFLKVYIDSSEHIVWGIQKDGNVVYGAGVPQQIVRHVEEVIAPFKDLFHYEDAPEYIDVKLDNKGRILESTKNDGTKYFANPVENNAAVISSIINPEYIDVKTDGEGRLLEGIKEEGSKYFAVPVENGAAVIKAVDNPEYVSVDLDADEKIINAIRTDGDAIYGGINISEIKRDLDEAALEVGFDDSNGDIYTIENNDSTISLEYNERTGDVYSIVDSKSRADITMDEDNGDIYIEEEQL